MLSEHDRYINRLAWWFATGNIICSYYWQSFDKVISFHAPGVDSLEYADWCVKVIQCDEYGTPLEGKEERLHCTTPDWGKDKLISRLNPIS